LAAQISATLCCVAFHLFFVVSILRVTPVVRITLCQESVPLAALVAMLAGAASVLG
jgi:hypothetical protein